MGLKLLAQGSVFLLEGSDAGLNVVHAFANFFGGVAGRDVLRAVPVVGLDVDDEDALDDGGVAGDADTLDPLGGFVAFENLNVAEYFQTSLARVVDQDHGDAIVGEEISGADVLLVAAIVCEREGMVVDDF